MPKNKLLIILCYVLVYVIWSTTYLAVKLGVSSIPVLLLVGLRWTFSGIFLTAIGFILYKKNFLRGITKTQIFHSLLAGLFILVINNLFFTESMKTLDTYIAAMMGATSPLLLTIFDYLINGIRFSKSTLLAILIGITGIGILLYKGTFLLAYDFHIITYLIGMLSFTFGPALCRKLKLLDNTVLNSVVQMYFTGIIGLSIFFISGNRIPLSSITSTSWMALLYLITFGGIGMLAYMYLIKNEPLSRVSSYTFVNAIGATIVGSLVGEKLTPNLFIAAPMIFIALVVILRSRAKTPESDLEEEMLR